jgi:hypothetical protein
MCSTRAAITPRSPCSDGEKRYLFGWSATRDGQDDYRPFQWGGSLVVHELFQRSDGSLGQTEPETVKNAWAPGKAIPFADRPRFLPGRHADGVFKDKMPEKYRMELT